MRPRDAPSDRRMAISRCRAVARESIRPARFAAAVSNTSPNATTNGMNARSTLNDNAIGVAAGSWIGGLIAGVIGAVIGTLGGAEIRSRLAAAFGRDQPAAFIEDVGAIILGLIIIWAAR